MFFYILFLKSESYYYVKVSQEEFKSLINDLLIEFKIICEHESAAYQEVYNYYYLKDGKKKFFGYAALVKKDAAENFLPSLL